MVLLLQAQVPYTRVTYTPISTVFSTGVGNSYKTKLRDTDRVEVLWTASNFVCDIQQY